jgi:tight adherence protein B
VLIALLAAAGLLTGAPWQLVAALALAVVQPWWFLGAAVAWGIFSRVRVGKGSGPDDEARLLHGMASELRAGASLRGALGAAATRPGDLPIGPAVRLAEAGRPATDVAAALQPALPVNGRLAAAAYRLASATGGKAADVFSALAVRAAERGEMIRERRAFTGQARLSALIVGIAPLALVLVLIVAGAGASFLELGTAGLVIGAVGLSLQATGAVVVWLMLRRAER